MRQREHPSDLYHSLSGVQAHPRWWRPTWPEKIISGYYAWNGRHCAESLIEGDEEMGAEGWREVAKPGRRDAEVTKSSLDICAALKTRR